MAAPLVSDELWSLVAPLLPHRWAVERTFAHPNRMRRLAVRQDRRVDIHHAFFTLGRALLAFDHLTRLCWRF